MIALPSDFVELALGLAAPVAEPLSTVTEFEEPGVDAAVLAMMTLVAGAALVEASVLGFGGGPVLFVTGTAPEMPPWMPPGGISDVKLVISAAD